MFLKYLKVTNVRSLQDFEMEFTQDKEEKGSIRKWSLLLGYNGTGKSTILKAIALVLSGSNALPHLLGDPGSWIRNKKKQCNILVKVVTKKNEERTISLTINKGDHLKDILQNNTDSLAELDNALEHTERNYFITGYGAYRRLAMKNQESAFKKRSFKAARVHCLETLFTPDTFLNPLQSWAMNLDYTSGAKGLNIVKTTMNHLLPDVSFVGIDKSIGDLIFKTPDGKVPLSHLSDGYQNVAAWLGDLLYRVTEIFQDYKNPLHARGLLLIDEIDSHLHPGWQRELRGFLEKKLPNLQIIATTHSPLTLHQFSQEECFILWRKNNKTSPTLKPFPVSPDQLRVHQLFNFGFDIPSLDSRRIELEKNQYRELRDKKKLSKSQKLELEELRGKLGDLPKSRETSFGNEALDEIVSNTSKMLKREKLVKETKKYLAKKVLKTTASLIKKKMETKSRKKSKTKASRKRKPAIVTS
jgi:predicted ATP-binding protein involved in virulence